MLTAVGPSWVISTVPLLPIFLLEPCISLLYVSGGGGRNWILQSFTTPLNTISPLYTLAHHFNMNFWSFRLLDIMLPTSVSRDVKVQSWTKVWTQTFENWTKVQSKVRMLSKTGRRVQFSVLILVRSSGPVWTKLVMDTGIVTHLSPLTSVYTLSNLPLYAHFPLLYYSTPLFLLTIPSTLPYSPQSYPVLLVLHLFLECFCFTFLFWK